MQTHEIGRAVPNEITELIHLISSMSSSIAAASQNADTMLLVQLHLKLISRGQQECLCLGAMKLPSTLCHRIKTDQIRSESRVEIHIIDNECDRLTRRHTDVELNTAYLI